jgi:putative membrane protein
VNRSRLARGADVVGAVAGAVTTIGMIATPLARQGGATRRVLSSVVVAGMAATTAARAVRVWGAPRTAVAAGATTVATAAVERIGTSTGLPFGRYHYTPALRPQVGGVPAIVPLAWFAMAVPARETAHAVLGRHSTPAARIAVGAVALTAWDLFLDPQMVGEGFWRWHRVGRYRGIPLTNFAGWLVTSAGVMAMLEVVLPRDQGGADAGMVGEYAFMGTMETLGFAAFFRDRLVAAVGGAAMLPLAAGAVRRVLDDRHWRMVGP